MEILIVVRGNVPAGELRFDPFQEVGIERHYVLVMAVLRTILHHPDLSVALDDLRLDLPDFLVHQIAPVLLAIEDRLPCFFYAIGAQRVGLAREPQCWLGLLPRLQQRFVRPLGRE